MHGRAPAAVQDAVLAAGRAAAGGPGDVGRRVVADGARGAGGGRLRAGARAAGGPRARARRADDRTGLAGRRTAAGGPGRPGGAGRGVPLLGAGGGRPAAAVPRAGDQGRRPDRVRAAGGLLGRSGGRRAGAAGPAAGRGDGGGPRPSCRPWARSTPRAGPPGAGVRMARLGLHPRLARALLDAAPAVGARAGRRGRRAAERGAARAATATTWPPRGGRPGAAATPTRRAGARRPAGCAAPRPRPSGRHRARRRGGGHRRGARNQRSSGGNGGADDRVAGLVAALAFPERVARGRGRLVPDGRRHRAPTSAEGSPLRGAPWLAVAVADRPGGQRARPGAARRRHRRGHRRGGPPPDCTRERDEVRWADGRRRRAPGGAAGRGGAGGRGRCRTPVPGRSGRRCWRGCGRRGSGCCGGRGTRRCCGSGWRSCTGRSAPLAGRRRTRRCSRAWRSGWSRSWRRARRRADLARIDAGQALNRLLPWATGEAAPARRARARADRGAERFPVRVDYGDPEQPVLAVKLQEMFGLQASPRVAGVPVLVHLLSPAGRPAAVTADLASFWRDGYRASGPSCAAAIRSIRGRRTRRRAEPTRHTNARLRR